MRHRKLNKKGFSLVELIAAVAILGVVVSPLLHTFVTSTKVSSRAQEITQGTLAAKNIIEAIDARPVSDFQQIINPDILGEGETAQSLAAELLKADDDNDVKITPIGVFDEHGLVTADVDIHGNVNDETEGNFTFAVQNIKAGNALYDAKVEFTRGLKPADYPEDRDDFVDNATVTSDGIFFINDDEIAKYSEMEGVFTQSYSPANNPDMLADSSFETLTKTDSTVDPNDYTRERNIRLIIYKDYQGLVWAKVIYVYSYTYYLLDDEGFRIEGSRGFKKKSVTGSDNSAFRFSYSLFPGGYEPVSSDGSVSVYMNFFPLIKTNAVNPDTGVPTSFTYEGDNIQIFKVVNAEEYDEENTEGDESKFYDFDLNLFFYKQKPVEFIETTAEDGTVTKTPREMEFDDIRFTNQYEAYVTAFMPEFKYDLYNTETLIYTNITQGMSSEELLHETVRGADYSLFDIDDLESIVAFAFGDDSSRHDDNLVLVDKLVRIYNVKVTVYPAGSAEINDEPYEKIIRGSTMTFHNTSGSTFNGESICEIEASKTP